VGVRGGMPTLRRVTAPALTDFFGLEGGPDWRLQVTEEICNAGGTLWGGVGLGAAMEAVERETGRATVWAAVQYIRPIHPGARLDLTVDVVRAGRQLTQAQVNGLSAGELAFFCMASLGPRARVMGEQPEGASQEPWRHGLQFVRIPDDVAPPDECPVRKIPVEMGTRRKLPDYFEQRWASPPRATPFDGTPGTGRTRLWLRFEQAIRPEERTGAALAVLADLAPSAIAEAVGVIAGGVSLDNTIRIARQWMDTAAADGGGSTDGGWILLDVTVESVIGDVAQLSARVFDPAGRLLAVAGQSAILRRFPRAE
jgi:acyl-CoA thioesterase-2